MINHDHLLVLFHHLEVRCIWFLVGSKQAELFKVRCIWFLVGSKQAELFKI